MKNKFTVVLINLIDHEQKCFKRFVCEKADWDDEGYFRLYNASEIEQIEYNSFGKLINIHHEKVDLVIFTDKSKLTPFIIVKDEYNNDYKLIPATEVYRDCCSKNTTEYCINKHTIESEGYRIWK